MDPQQQHDIRRLETSVDKAHTDFISKMQQFMVQARQHISSTMGNDRTPDCVRVLHEFDDIMIHINRIDFYTLRNLVHDIVKILSDEENSSGICLKLRHLYTKYQSQLPKLSDRKKINTEATNLMQSVLQSC